MAIAGCLQAVISPGDLFCSELCAHSGVNAPGSPLGVSGDRYIVVDSGGGTVDMTVHQIRLPEGHLKELYKATGNVISTACFM